MGQSSRDRASSKDDKVDEKEEEPEVIFQPSPALVEAVQDDAPSPEPAPAQVPEMSRDEDLAAALNRIAGELARLKAAYGEPVARITGERALTLMRRA